MRSNNLRVLRNEGEYVPLTFREKTYNFSINLVGILLAIFVGFFEIFLLPIGLVAGLALNKYPRWAAFPISRSILRAIPDDENEKKGDMTTAPFYRRK